MLYFHILDIQFHALMAEVAEPCDEVMFRQYMISESPNFLWSLRFLHGTAFVPYSKPTKVKMVLLTIV